MTVLIRVRRIVADDAHQLLSRKTLAAFWRPFVITPYREILVKVLHRSCLVYFELCFYPPRNQNEGIFALQQFRGVLARFGVLKQQQIIQNN